MRTITCSSRRTKNGVYHTNADNYLFFEAYEAFTINSVKVYANGAGNRTIAVIDRSNGSTVASGVFSVPDGESRVDLEFDVPGPGEYGLRGGWHNLFLTDLEGGLTLGGGLELPVFSAGTLCVDGAWEEFGRLGEVVKYSLRFKW